MLPAAAAAASFGSAAFAPASDMPLRHNFIHQLRSVSYRPMRRIERCSIKLGVRTPHPNTKLLFVSSPLKSSFFNILNHLENTCVFSILPNHHLEMFHIFPTKNSHRLESSHPPPQLEPRLAHHEVEASKGHGFSADGPNSPMPPPQEMRSH